MSEEIKVHVVNRGRRYLYMRFLCPDTGRFIERSTKFATLKDANREAAKWEDQLREGRYQKRSKMDWQTFREFYSTNALAGLAPRTGEACDTAFNAFTKATNPQKLSDVTTAKVTAFVRKLRDDGKSEASIASYLRQLKAALRWANRQGLLAVVPTFDMPKRVKGAKVMRGRPITGEEFDRMIAAVPRVVDNMAAESWRFYLRCLWESGLRLSESLTLRWDDAPEAIVVDLTGRRPMLRIAAEAEKGNCDRLLPMTPQFAALVESVPEAERRGRVFKLLAPDGKPQSLDTSMVSRVVSAIGKAAGVVVDERTKGDRTVRKFASAHDLRRAFAARWSRKLHPTDLQQLMRHESMTTTLAYYVGADAEATADAIWAASDTFSDTRAQKKTGRRKHPAK